MSRLTPIRILPVVLALGLTLLTSSVTAAQSADVPFRPACQLADDAAASAALGVDVVGDDSISNSYCTYTAGDTMIGTAILMSDLTLDLGRLGFPGAADLTIAGHAAIASPGDNAGTAPTVLVALDDGGLLMVNVMAEAGLDDPVAAATALAGALLASGPVTAQLPVEATGPAIEFAGDPCTMVSLGELGDTLGLTFTTADPDGSGGCTYQTNMTDELAIVSLAFSDGTLAALRSGSTTDLAIGDRRAIFWPDLASLFVDAGGGRLFSVMLLDMSAPQEAGPEQLQEKAAAIAELAISRMTPAAG